MIPTSSLPALNAALNATSTLLLLLGYFFIRRKQVLAHKLCMLSACGTSALFLASYLVYHFQVGSVPFQGAGWIRPVYFGVLLSHTLLAIAIPPLVLTVLYYAARERFDSHRRLARRTLPVWLYVSATGVLIYWMLYHMRVD